MVEFRLKYMEKKVLFIGEAAWLYQLQTKEAGVEALAFRNFGASFDLLKESDEVRSAIRLVFLGAPEPFPHTVFQRAIMANLPNAGLLFVGQDPMAVKNSLYASFHKIPDHIYGMREQMTPWIMCESIGKVFMSDGHVAARSSLKELWGDYLQIL